jgi:preprotein translocase subunit SecE
LKAGTVASYPLLIITGYDGTITSKKRSSKKIKKGKTADEARQNLNSPAGTGINATGGQKNLYAGQQTPVVKEKTFIDKGLQFLREVKVELKKVTWPSRKQTMGSTVVVLVIVTIISLFLGIVDAGLSGLIRAVLQ